MEIRQLRHFLAVAEKLNFRSAAERVHLTQQAVSKSILQFEKELGVQLFERGRQSVILTETGKLLIPHVRDVIADIKRLEDAVTHAAGNKHGQLRIGATPTLLEEIVPRSLHAFIARAPDVGILVERGDFALLRDMMLRGDLDLVLSTEPEEMPGHLLASRTIATDRNVILVRSGHPLAQLQTVTASDLAAYSRTAIHNFARGEHYLERLFAQQELPVARPALRAGSTHFAISWVAQSDHWVVAPQLRVQRALRDDSLRALPVALVDETWNIVLVTRRHASRSRLQAIYVEELERLLLLLNEPDSN